MEKKEAVQQQKTHKIRITLTSLEVPKIEKVSAELVANAKNKDLEVHGPKRMPTKIMRITTRRTPCGEGSKTWDRFQMRIHKRVIDFEAPASEVKDITKISVPSGVEVEVTIISN